VTKNSTGEELAEIGQLTAAPSHSPTARGRSPMRKSCDVHCSMRACGTAPSSRTRRHRNSSPAA
jgi:hypothetical protein